ncbi:LLM class flavin-dependent oxidoreductase [Solwaraspora sp. WMMA2080]|uniref:LLM class flavin-dependent oxidoreductase n=1 Tax=unclassified Solwaraspora TaxID=2627926 RepID=UPI00248C925C|nr:MULTISPECIES: LLM class flavin-dependent oxidoreductase [unclassified Solwaraspora]WBB95167.1 LLM class flavin-dependent oxidoreductase [Solwaraspora sp. WMMA2059]WBC20927.1 LLM class flavin-dependent oxidoreductase [Solwaraspora sp. WMMA2080]WBC20949.1 LLM class flavin-dependent oxidoreductase [Solwaraspora sp. WMMA2080]
MTAEPTISTAAGDLNQPAVDLFLLAAHGLPATVGYARAAEAAGLGGVWLAEHHFVSYGQCPSATTLAGYLLGATRRIAVGTAAAVLSNRHPVALAEEAVLLDTVSAGRFRLGVARGGPWVDLEVYGTGLDRYRDGFAESLDLLSRWLSGAATVGADGQFFTFRDVPVVPRPARPMPIWIAATSPATVDLAASRGLALLLGVHDDDAAKAATLARYADVAAANGHDPAIVPHASVHLIGLADSRAAAERVLRRTLPPWLATTREYVRIDGSAPAHRDLDAYAEHLLRIHPLGSAAECAARLAASAATIGAHRLVLMVEGAGPAATGDLITAIGTDLLPALP